MRDKSITKERRSKDVPGSDKGSKSSRFLTYIFWTMLVLLLFAWVFDYVKVVNGNAPQLCVHRKTHSFDDGNVEECIGLGYKVYNYDRSSLGVKTQFGPFFMKMRE